MKTKTSKRDITIPNALINYLKEIKEERNAKDTDYVITELNTPNSSIPCKSNNLNSNFTSKIDFLNKNNDFKIKKISLNGLRHTHTTMLVTNNVNIKIIASRLGHGDIATTLKYYTHVTKEMEKETANLLDKLF